MELNSPHHKDTFLLRFNATKQRYIPPWAHIEINWSMALGLDVITANKFHVSYDISITYITCS